MPLVKLNQCQRALKGLAKFVNDQSICAGGSTTDACAVSSSSFLSCDISIGNIRKIYSVCWCTWFIPYRVTAAVLWWQPKIPTAPIRVSFGSIKLASCRGVWDAPRQTFPEFTPEFDITCRGFNKLQGKIPADLSRRIRLQNELNLNIVNSLVSSNNTFVCFVFFKKGNFFTTSLYSGMRHIVFKKADSCSIEKRFSFFKVRTIYPFTSVSIL